MLAVVCIQPSRESVGPAAKSLLDRKGESVLFALHRNEKKTILIPLSLVGDQREHLGPLIGTAHGLGELAKDWEQHCGS